MLPRNRILTVLATASYLVVVLGATLFHDHHDQCEHCDHCDDLPRPGLSASEAADAHECLICQFLAQKLAPIDAIEQASSIPLVHEVAMPAPPLTRGGHFTAWHSRAPPKFA